MFLYCVAIKSAVSHFTSNIQIFEHLGAKATLLGTYFAIFTAKPQGLRIVLLAKTGPKGPPFFRVSL